MRREFGSDQGFTLVELMVVVLIIGILITIAVPVFTQAIATARHNACLGSMRVVESTIIMFDATNPDSPILTTAGVASYETAIDRLVPGSLKAVPKCPSKGVYSFGVNGIVQCSIDGTVQ